MQKVKDYLLNVIVAVVTMMALFLGGQRVWQSFAATDGTTTIRDWQRYGDAGQHLGPDSASVVIVWFGDYQCPYCQMAAVDLDNLRAKYPNDLATVFRHFPLSGIHPEALSAATAAECAAAQGRFEPFHRMLFADAISLGTKPWHAFASDAGVESIQDFESCLDSDEPRTALAEDLLAANALGVVGTPAFLINDKFVPAYPGAAMLEGYVTEALQQ